MMTFLLHPDFIELSRYTDGELSPPEASRVEGHLHGCASCRAELDFIRELGDTARALPAPGPSEDALDKVLARRAAGERVIVPVSGPVDVDARPRGFLRLAAAIVGPLIAVAAAALILAPGAEADRGRLEFSDATPEAGQELEVEYKGGRLFEGESRLVLRGQYRYEGGTTEIRTADLPRVEDGVYRADIVLPDSLAYAAFAVEDPSADRVDSNGRRLWEVVVHGEDGKPTFAALKERAGDMVGRNWEVAYQTAVRMTELYPDEPYGWYTRLVFGRQFLSDGSSEAVLQQHAREYRRLAALEGSRELERLTWLVNYGRGLGAEGPQRALEGELFTRAAQHPMAISLRVGELTADNRLPELDTLETLWKRATDDQSRRDIATPAFRAARATHDPKLIATWAKRLLEVSSQNRLSVAEQLSRGSQTRELGLSELRAILAKLEHAEPAARPLVESRSAYQFATGRRIQKVLAAIGTSLIAEGEVRAGLDTLRLSAEMGWSPEVLGAAASTALEQGDTASALDFLARIAVDPATTPAGVDRATAMALRRLTHEEWEVELMAAKRRMEAMVLANGVRRHLPEDLELTNLDGSTVQLNQLRDRRPTFFAFWTRRGATSMDGLPGLLEVVSAVEEMGGRAVLVTDELAYPELRRFAAEHAPGAPFYVDASGEVARAFGQWGTPEFFVVDADGVIRFEYSELDSILRQIAVLLPRSTAASVADR